MTSGQDVSEFLDILGLACLQDCLFAGLLANPDMTHSHNHHRHLHCDGHVCECFRGFSSEHRVQYEEREGTAKTQDYSHI
jgi:hypothetical protein